jgi:hypothetical protein
MTREMAVLLRIDGNEVSDEVAAGRISGDSVSV